MSNLTTLAVLPSPAKALTSLLKIDLSEKLENRRFEVYFNDVVSGNNDSLDVIHRPFGTSKYISNKRPNFHFVQPVVPQPEISKYLTEQEYEGTVVSVNSDGTFTARLTDLTHNGPDEEGEFNLSELNGDEKLAVPGAQFTWVIGLQKRGTSEKRVSEIRFRRLPAFSKETIDRAEQKAAAMASFFEGSSDSNQPFEFDL